METSSVTLTSVKEEAHDCDCGCAPCEKESCGLSCTTRPNFFCGQLLTDQDLTALVSWTQDRLRLQRYRSGWGVACGLDVQRVEDKPGYLVVSPGYAVSCCGDDLVLCSEVKVDLTQVCQPQADPCDEPGDYDSDEFFYDLVLQYAEEPSAFQTALGCSDGQREADCEPSRIVESASVAIVPVDSDEPDRQPVKDWLRKYQGWWQKWLDDNRVRSEDYRIWWYRLLEAFWREPTRDGCHVCHKESGVPLARVCLRRVDDRCVIVVIDAHPPNRRPLSLDDWPEPRSRINFAQFLGRSWREAAAPIYDYLRHHGITLGAVETATYPAEVIKLVEQEPLARFDSKITPVVVDMGKLGPRLVGFKEVSTAPHEPYKKRHDLTKLYGIGEKSAEALYAAGIVTYQQLVKLSREEMQRIVNGSISQSRYDRCMAEAHALIEKEAGRE